MTSKIDEMLMILDKAGRTEDAMKLLKVLSDESISDTMIARLLTTSDFKIERKAVKRWRRKNGMGGHDGL